MNRLLEGAARFQPLCEVHNPDVDSPCLEINLTKRQSSVVGRNLKVTLISINKTVPFEVELAISFIGS
jgi:hypothetical protein